ncbi:CHASE2 domain-containing protein [Catenovulum sediminis]|uniref:CHASE2 domain-containing protein n=1 Tax=Catenovulum sediminis TaxID=1740262 RepID=UPI00117D65DC|nr:adenylate/guanylate cyclase domain-containing protein [Catenovulum sediminis]
MRYLSAILMILIVAGGCLLHQLSVLKIPILDDLQRTFYDFQIQLSPFSTSAETLDVVIVNIDEKSLAAYGQWPWRRDILAQLVEHLFNHYQIKTLGFDMVFAEPSDTTAVEVLDLLAATELHQNALFQKAYQSLKPQLDFDALFAQSIQSHSVALGMVFNSDVEPNVNQLPLPLLTLPQDRQQASDLIQAQSYIANLAAMHQNASGAGFFDNPLLDDDGVFRRVPLVQSFRGHVYPSLALEMARLAIGAQKVDLVLKNIGGALIPEQILLAQKQLKLDSEGAVYVPYLGAAFHFNYYSVFDVFENQILVEALRDKVVLLGTDSAGLLDLRTTPFGSLFPGVEVHANIVQGILSDNLKYQPQNIMSYQLGALVVSVIAVILLILVKDPRWQLTVWIGGIITALALTQYGWEMGWILPNALAIAQFVFTGAFVIATTLLFEFRKKHSIVRRFGQYVPPALVSDMAKSPDRFQLVGQQKTLTVMFSDIRDFTRISEGLNAVELSELINRYLTTMTQIIHQHNGTIDKYIGDAIMAFWGAPVDNANHAIDALNASVEMQLALVKLNKEFVQKGWPQLAVGIGINSGEMHVGNMGSEFRMAYTVMGDEVNLASRLEGLTKVYDSPILLSENTYQQVQSSVYMLREIDRVRVKGKQKAISLYQLAFYPHEEAVQGALTKFARFLDLYRTQQWLEAKKLLDEMYRQTILSDELYQLYRLRIQFYQITPPAEDWDGVYTYQVK